LPPDLHPHLEHSSKTAIAIMTDNARYGNPADFDVDLHSIYAAYL
jgi:hypothetical protein